MARARREAAGISDSVEVAQPKNAPAFDASLIGKRLEVRCRNHSRITTAVTIVVTVTLALNPNPNPNPNPKPTQIRIAGVLAIQRPEDRRDSQDLGVG